MTCLIHCFLCELWFLSYFSYICCIYTAGHSGLVQLERLARIEPALRTGFCLSRKSLQYAALGTGYTLIALSRSTQPSTLLGSVNEYQPHGWVIIHSKNEKYNSLQAESKVIFADWPISWQPPGTDRLSLRWPKVNSRIWLRTANE